MAEPLPSVGALQSAHVWRSTPSGTTAAVSIVDPSASFHLSVDEHGVIIASGEIDMVAGPQLEELVLPLERPGSVVIDMSEVSFLDSSGLRTLLKISRVAGERGDQVVLRSPSAEVDRLLELTGTREQFTYER